jgi:electron transport complex protein RnfG
MVDESAVDESRRSASAEVELTKPPKGSVVAQAWLVLVLAAAFGAALAGVERKFGPIIAQNKLNETIAQVPALVPGAVGIEPDTQSVPGRRIFRAVNGDGDLVGWVVQSQGRGFADKIELNIGLDAQAATITGLFVLDQKETPGLGDNITTQAFRDRFKGFGTDVTLVAQAAPTNRETGVVQALSGATISSDAVCTIVNEAVSQAKQPLAVAARAASVAPRER